MLPDPHPPRRHDPLEGIDPDGFITTGACRAHLAPAFQPVLDAALAHWASHAGTASLYVYGSVATGMARPGLSDVDLVSIGLPPGQAAALAAGLSARFRQLCRTVELGPAQLADYQGTGDEAHGNRVFLRHYGVHLAGPDIAAGLPRQRADAAAARGFNGDIGRLAARWRAQLPQAGAAERALLARRLARKTLFAVTGLVSLHDHTWTTDRLAAARRWATLAPEWAEGLATLADWAERDGPAPGADALQAALDGVVAAVVSAFQDRIGLWPEAPAPLQPAPPAD